MITHELLSEMRAKAEKELSNCAGGLLCACRILGETHGGELGGRCLDAACEVIEIADELSGRAAADRKIDEYEAQCEQEDPDHD